VPAEQEALGDQLAVGVDHESARDPEVRGEHPRRRQAGVWREPAGADGVAQPVGELAMQRIGCRPVKLDQQLRT
jgi:hypothetical protein